MVALLFLNRQLANGASASGQSNVDVICRPIDCVIRLKSFTVASLVD